MEETTAVRRLCGNLLHTSLPSTYTPLEILQETILCRLPVKSLLRFRCVCNSWDSLISKDLKFAKKHLRMSPKRQHLVTTTWKDRAEKLTVICSPFNSLNLHSNFDSKLSTQHDDYSPIISSNDDDGLIASCNGILCFAIDQRLTVLYNPSIRKVEKLPYIDLPRVQVITHYAFGYDPFIDNYKVIVVFIESSRRYYEHTFENQVIETHSYTLGTDSWQRIKDFPSMFRFHRFRQLLFPQSKHGIFLRGMVNWLTFSGDAYDDDDVYLNAAIVSLHLENESYQEISLPDLSDVPIGKYQKILTLDVMRDCLCLFVISQEREYDSSTDVWLMKEYGNKESWIKLINLPSFGSYAYLTDIVYISEDNHDVLLVFRDNHKFKLIVYDLKNDIITVKRSKSQENLGKVKSKVYVESLISP